MAKDHSSTIPTTPPTVDYAKMCNFHILDDAFPNAGKVVGFFIVAMLIIPFMHRFGERLEDVTYTKQTGLCKEIDIPPLQQDEKTIFFRRAHRCTIAGNEEDGPYCITQYGDRAIVGDSYEKCRIINIYGPSPYPDTPLVRIRTQTNVVSFRQQPLSALGHINI